MSFNIHPLNICIIEDNAGDFLLFEAYLQQTKLPIQDLVHLQKLNDALTIDKNTDIVFLDLTLPDSSGLDSFNFLNKLLPNVPIVVLSGMSSETVAIECISNGAQDYLIKDELNEKLLKKSIQYSVERKKNLRKLKEINDQYTLIGKITNDIIWKWDFKTNEIISHSESFFDYCKEDIQTCLSWWIDKIHVNDREKINTIIQDFLQGKIETAQTEYRFKCANGAYKYVYNRAFLMRNEKGEPYAIVSSMMDISELHNLQDELLEQQIQHQKQLTEATILGQEKEKEELGKELHDNINQILTSVKLYLDTAISNDDIKDAMIKSARENLICGISEIRKLSHSLISPSLEDHGLIETVEELIEELNKIDTFSAKLVLEDFDESLLDNNKKLMLYRIVQEQINNIIKYAKAKEVIISLKFIDDKFILDISDNGIGFDTTRKVKGIGFRNIESRVSYYSGDVKLNSAPNEGTTLKVFLPV